MAKLGLRRSFPSKGKSGHYLGGRGRLMAFFFFFLSLEAVIL